MRGMLVRRLILKMPSKAGRVALRVCLCCLSNQVSCARYVFFFSSRRRHTRLQGDWSSDVCSSDLNLRQRGVISVAEMAEVLGTTEITVRRDMRAMARDGLLVRAHGGAVLPAAIGHEPSYSEKAHQAGAEKASIARLAVELILPGDPVLVGAGPTTVALARLLTVVPLP